MRKKMYNIVIKFCSNHFILLIESIFNLFDFDSYWLKKNLFVKKHYRQI